MRLIIILCLFIFVIFLESLSTSASYYDKFVTDQNSHRMFFRLMDHGVRVTILSDMENDTDVALKQSIINGILFDQSILLKNKNYIKSKGKRIYATKDPNVVIITKDFDKVISNKQLHKTILKFNKSLVYLIITTSDNTYRCIGGKFNASVFNDIQNWMNEFWHSFEIFTVVVIFPFTCPHVNIIYHGKTQSNKPLYDRTIKTVEARDFPKLVRNIKKSSRLLSRGYPLRAAIFERFPTSILSCSNITQYVKWNKTNTNNGFCGLDALVLNDFINFFGFNVTFHADKECERYGYMSSEDNTTRGSLGCIVNGKLDISFNSRFMVQYSNKECFYLFYVTTDSLCVLLKQPELKPLWLYPKPCTNVVWLLIVALVMLLGTAAWFFAKMSAKMTGGEIKMLHYYMLDSCACTLFGYSFDKHSRTRVIKGTCLLCSIIFTSMYQCHVNYSFTTVTRFEKIKTLDDLYRSGVTLHTSSSIKSLLKNLENPNDPYQVKFLEQAKLYNRTDIGALLTQKNTARLVRKADSNIEIMLKYVDHYHRPMLYIVNECFNLYYLSYITRAGFPFAKEMILFMQHLVEAGLPGMYYEWTARSLGVTDSISKYSVEKRPYAPITIGDQRLAFALLVGGQLMSVIVFIIEKVMYYRQNYSTSDENQDDSM